uniref:Uncharacterized protein MANES_12G074500 n=1 Tax=Rhizophora mucronata TaxID=61149 RepID=A0A2P2K5S2_RHIMU
MSCPLALWHLVQFDRLLRQVLSPVHCLLTIQMWQNLSLAGCILCAMLCLGSLISKHEGSLFEKNSVKSSLNTISPGNQRFHYCILEAGRPSGSSCKL